MTGAIRVPSVSIAILRSVGVLSYEGGQTGQWNIERIDAALLKRGGGRGMSG